MQAFFVVITGVRYACVCLNGTNDSRKEEVEDDQRSGRPSTSRTADNTEQVKQLVRADRRLTVRMIASELFISKETVWKIITEDLGMRKICAKMVPKLLSDDQKSGECSSARTFLNVWKLNQTCLVKSLLESLLMNLCNQKLILSKLSKIRQLRT